MGTIWGSLPRNPKKREMKGDSPKDIYIYVCHAIAHFTSGVLTGLAVFLFAILLTFGVDTTQVSVIDTNERLAMILMSASFSLVAFLGCRGAFGYRLFESSLGSYETFSIFLGAAGESRIKRGNWAKTFLTFLYIVFTIPGFFLSAAIFKAGYGS